MLPPAREKQARGGASTDGGTGALNGELRTLVGPLEENATSRNLAAAIRSGINYAEQAHQEYQALASAREPADWNRPRTILEQKRSPTAH